MWHANLTRLLNLNLLQSQRAEQNVAFPTAEGECYYMVFTALGSDTRQRPVLTWIWFPLAGTSWKLVVCCKIWVYLQPWSFSTSAQFIIPTGCPVHRMLKEMEEYFNSPDFVSSCLALLFLWFGMMLYIKTIGIHDRDLCFCDFG